MCVYKMHFLLDAIFVLKRFGLLNISKENNIKKNALIIC